MSWSDEQMGERERGETLGGREENCGRAWSIEDSGSINVFSGERKGVNSQIAKPVEKTPHGLERRVNKSLMIKMRE